MANHRSTGTRTTGKRELEALTMYRFEDEDDRLSRYERISFGITLGECEERSVFHVPQ